MLQRLIVATSTETSLQCAKEVNHQYRLNTEYVTDFSRWWPRPSIPSQPRCAYYDKLMPPVGTNEILSYRRSRGLLPRRRTRSTCHLLLSNISWRLRCQSVFSSTLLEYCTTGIDRLVLMKPSCTSQHEERSCKVFCALLSDATAESIFHTTHWRVSSSSSSSSSHPHPYALRLSCVRGLVDVCSLWYKEQFPHLCRNASQYDLVSFFLGRGPPHGHEWENSAFWGTDLLSAPSTCRHSWSGQQSLSFQHFGWTDRRPTSFGSSRDRSDEAEWPDD